MEWVIVAVLLLLTAFLYYRYQHVLKEKQVLQRQCDFLSHQIEVEKKAFQEAQMRATDTFKSLSTEALALNNRLFMDLAQSTFSQLQEKASQDLTHREKSISDMVAPVKEALLKVDEKIHLLEKERVKAYEGLTQQVQHLHDSQKDLKRETHNLVNALRKPHVRGRWGEIQLKRVVELAGMLPHCDFDEQASLEDLSRPDLLVKLPGEKCIIIDAKVPLGSYLEAIETPNEEEKREKMTSHARALRQHIKALASRSYWEKLPQSPEFVVLFLPGDPFFAGALDVDPTLLEYALQEKIILATPTTLIALLRAAAYGWQQEKIAEHAQDICKLGQELHKRLGDMTSHLSRLGRMMGSAVEAYNSTIGTLERRVLPSTRKFKELQVTNDDLEEPPLLDQTLREVPHDRSWN